MRFQLPPGPDRDMFINYFTRFDTFYTGRETNASMFEYPFTRSESKLLVNIANIRYWGATQWISDEI